MSAVTSTPQLRADRVRWRQAVVVAVASVVFAGAIFGFFYAWVCSTMWGLDAADPRIAIGAMQAMNASVRNAVFFPAFFLTPVVMAVAAGLCRRARQVRAMTYLLLAAVVYAGGGLLLTLAVNVPMNEELARVAVPTDLAPAAAIWRDYSARWQAFNTVRAIASAMALVLACLAVLELGGRRRDGVGT